MRLRIATNSPFHTAMLVNYWLGHFGKFMVNNGIRWNSVNLPVSQHSHSCLKTPVIRTQNTSFFINNCNTTRFRFENMCDFISERTQSCWHLDHTLALNQVHCTLLLTCGVHVDSLRSFRVVTVTKICAWVTRRQKGRTQVRWENCSGGFNSLFFLFCFCDWSWIPFMFCRSKSACIRMTVTMLKHSYSTRKKKNAFALCQSFFFW